MRKVRLDKAIIKTKDIKPCENHEEHLKRVLSRESTPWIRYRFEPRLPKKIATKVR